MVDIISYSKAKKAQRAAEEAKTTAEAAQTAAETAQSMVGDLQEVVDVVTGKTYKKTLLLEEGELIVRLEEV